ncbi:hypothetical protein CEE37_08250 [candidate division LCP-89 bacterium B3_LCP]|uniref:Uncharacterized protein n=1 Tax=candidate division LCP-89 bacterium B3_LCP TaxID=2012998 RepID=A0A532V006_UNCL8|nr:MAG: hypothetical protein CEE37_08250 [candidate division LCP-89 bacterium B3_LCP]
MVAETCLYRTLGCKQNQFDTQSLRLYLERQGFAETQSLTEADWCVINTCSVTERALAKVRGEINRIRRSNPNVKIVALGCGARHNRDNFTKADYIDQPPPAFELDEWYNASSHTGIGSNLLPPHGIIPSGRSRALLRIQNGCDQKCAYCIVPHLRGSSRSVGFDACVDALKSLVDQGAVEIVLTGTNIASWGRDLAGDYQFSDLLKVLVQEIGNSRLRLSSLEPQLISPDLIEWCTEQPQICRHFHFAVQSGSQTIVNSMNRGNFPQEIYRYLENLVRNCPDVSVGADIITGFPGETDDDFEKTVELISAIPFSYLHVFPYSERVGTEAANRQNQVPVRKRLGRAQHLRKIDDELRDRFAQLNSGKMQDIVIIGDGHNGKMDGLTSNYLPVNFQDGFVPPDDRFSAKILASQSELCVQ